MLNHRWVFKGRATKPTREFMVRWEGYSPEHDSWEPESGLENCSGPLQKYRDESAAAGVDIDVSPPLKSKKQKGVKPAAADAAAAGPARTRGRQRAADAVGVKVVRRAGRRHRRRRQN